MGGPSGEHSKTKGGNAVGAPLSSKLWRRKGGFSAPAQRSYHSVMAIRLLHFGKDQAKAIEAYESFGAYSSELAHGNGEVHTYVIHFRPGGAVGPHPAGFDQVFLVVQGSGWVAGSDGVRHSVVEGCAAFVPTGELHSKGSETGMLAVMIQASNLRPLEAP